MISKMFNLIKRGIITLTTKDDSDFQICQVEYLGKVKNIELVLPYGLYANPQEQSLVLMFNIGANEENISGIPYNPYNRFKNLEKGEVVVGNPNTGAKIHFKANGDIDIETDGAININSTGSVNINGDTEPLVRGNALKTLFNSHTHTSAASGSPTTAPLQPITSAELSTKNFTE